MTVTPKVVLAPSVGRCIYCGATRYWDKNNRKLGDEHIVPRGLGGHHILPNASCHRCENAINQAEKHVMQGMLHFARRLAGVKPRKKRNHNEFKVRNHHRPARLVSVDGKYALPILCMPRFLPPRVFPREKDKENLLGEVFVCSWDKDFTIDKALVGPEGIYAFELEVDARLYFRMLAKIAHAATTARFGYGNFEPLLTEFIRGEPVLPDPTRFIGGEMQHLSAEGAAYRWQITEHEEADRTYLIVAFRLLANIEATPIYLVVAGYRWRNS